MIPYFDYKPQDNSAINIEVFKTMNSVPIHQHKNISLPLIPGDVFTIPPHQEQRDIIRLEFSKVVVWLKQRFIEMPPLG